MINIIDNNRIGDKGAKVISESLKNNKSISILSLRNINNIIS